MSAKTAAVGSAPVARWVLVGCASGRPVEETPQSDDRLERTNRVAHVAFKHGRYAQAASLYRQVADLAYERDDVNAAVDAQYNAAVCLVRLDQVDEADALLQRTKAELGRAGQAEPIELRLLEATVLYRQRRYQEAWSLAEQHHFQRPGFPGGTPGAVSSRPDRRGSGRSGTLAAPPLPISTLPPTIASKRIGSELAGHLALLEQRYDASVADFAEAARLRSAGSDYRGTVRALAKAGETAEAAGRLSQASVHYLRAGRSALHQGARERAHELLTRCPRLANQAGDAETAREAQLYLTLLKESEPEPASGS